MPASNSLPSITLTPLAPITEIPKFRLGSIEKSNEVSLKPSALTNKVLPGRLTLIGLVKLGLKLMKRTLALPASVEPTLSSKAKISPVPFLSSM